MPSSLTNTSSNRQSWPPTQLRLVRGGSHKSIEPRPLLEDIDEDPLTYFLTPNPDDDEDDDDDELPFADFDAGIEVAGRPRRDDLVRSVSPSTLDGLGKIRRAAASPSDFDSDGLTSDDDDGEDYVRLSPSPSPPPVRQGLAVPPPPQGRHSFTVGSYPFGLRSRSPVARTASPPFQVSSSFPPPGFRGRPAATARRGRWSVPGAATQRVARPGHLWREPSADVWSIEEETEEELTRSETRGRFAAARAGATRGQGAKPMKRVRFVLPSEQ
ncbi:hypothetical protein ISF_03993 [Cordyceps fumosorosea ARSEF 2679]|uniref:Uncharacterized protein n=1 Tax=Cordyceps fumosorosea (strain ARSEF 2679) TaxID=1081104 RepID=A0A167YCC6_CORFA|nr:hypothetical protein ISF_03993 [Cordyceps fumosorosea ARSEF 2679]OAA66155.1 hypothetical protein ISF_03993 [Cordyceps fumosorosea ARSEF 2679]